MDDHEARFYDGERRGQERGNQIRPHVRMKSDIIECKSDI